MAAFGYGWDSRTTSIIVSASNGNKDLDLPLSKASSVVAHDHVRKAAGRFRARFHVQAGRWESGILVFGAKDGQRTAVMNLCWLTADGTFTQKINPGRVRRRPVLYGPEYDLVRVRR